MISESLIGGLVIFVLATFLGAALIGRVPPTLHTPLMSGSNAISGITIVNLAEGGNAGGLLDGEYSFFSPGDIELNDVTKAIVDVATRVKPRRAVFDPFSDVKLLARDPLRRLHRRHVVGPGKGAVALQLDAHAAGVVRAELAVEPIAVLQEGPELLSHEAW